MRSIKDFFLALMSIFPWNHPLLLLLTLEFDLNLLDIPSVEQSYASLSYRDFTSSLLVWTSYDSQNWPQNVK